MASMEGRTRHERAWGPDLAHGEALLVYHAWDRIPCECPSTYDLSTVECAPVGMSQVRGRPLGPVVYRCLQCGASWS